MSEASPLDPTDLAFPMKRPPMHRLAAAPLLAALAALATSCAQPPFLREATARPEARRFEPPAEAGPAPQDEKKDKKKGDEEESGRGLVHVVLLYIPNRILDLFDVARFGVEVGLGIGIDAEATDALRGAAMFRTSAGAGLQGLRHLPVKLSSEGYAGFGPIDLGADPGLPWYRDFWDVRLDVFVALVGAHVAVNPKEIADFVLGFATIDIADDDF